MNSASDPLATEQIFTTLEQAIDHHPRLCRLTSIGGEPELRLSRLGVMLRIAVKLRTSPQGAVGDISARGRDLDEALHNLVQNLDTWAVAMGAQPPINR